jgi:hypothetical protein
MNRVGAASSRDFDMSPSSTERANYPNGGKKLRKEMPRASMQLLMN